MVPRSERATHLFPKVGVNLATHNTVTSFHVPITGLSVDGENVLLVS